MSNSENYSITASELRKLCLDQAQNFIDAAEILLATGKFYHIVYHLSLLALEEIGKASLVVARSVVGEQRDASWIDKVLDSHKKKLQWALWSPMERIDPKDFESAREFSEHAHELRLSSLYVDAKSELSDLPPIHKITLDRANSLLNLARSRLKLEDTREVPLQGHDDLLEWFLDTMADQQQSKYLLSKKFIAKYEEMGADARSWVAWVRDELKRNEIQADEILQTELKRSAAPAGSGKAKWRAVANVYTPSHSLRPKVLTSWNEKLEAIQLLWTGKKDSFQLQLTLFDNTDLSALYGRSTTLAKLAVACLNMGSIGYFWFQRPGFEQNLFKDVRDLEQNEMSLSIKKRESFWGDGRAVALTEQHITNALECMMAFMSLEEAEANLIFSPYFHGLALIAKSDEFYDFDEMARRAFGASLGGALHKYAGWDGSSGAFESTFHNAFMPFMPEKEHRDQMFRVLSPEGEPEETSLERLRSTKQLADLYLIHRARLNLVDRANKNRESKSQESP